MSDGGHAAGAKAAPAWRGWAAMLVVAGATFGLGLLAASIIERREEARAPLPLRPIDAMEVDNALWGENFPRQYASYKLMLDDTTRTRYGGSFPRDYLAETPANVVLFAGYGFAKEYQQARGHLFAVEDVTTSKRVDAKTPGTCFTCKSPDVPRLMAKLGPARFYSTPFAELKPEVTHPIGCLDCHEPNTMRLRVTRPALREAFQRMGRDVDQVSHQEMRSLVCAQCHVEYYFQGPDKYLAFPWDKGTRAEEMEEYYDQSQFADWTHAVSKAPMLKMQHPDYEVYLTGIHAYRNVACADCHMPYRTEGGAKFTDHRVQSPLLNLSNSCAVCHRWSEQELRSRVESIQDKVREGRTRAETMLARAHFDIAAAMQAGAGDDELAGARDLVRKAQMRWDYVAANNGMGFHSPQECMRVLDASVDLGAQSRLDCAQVLARHGVTEAVRYPDYSSKEKAQALNQAFIDGKPPVLVDKKR